ncbi:MAG: hypothetical protein Q4C70_08410, partial [Planctomycetia bacterium]|nr:hypothetical protein [Planctomycetia bacterium]
SEPETLKELQNNAEVITLTKEELEEIDRYIERYGIELVPQSSIKKVKIWAEHKVLKDAVFLKGTPEAEEELEHFLDLEVQKQRNLEFTPEQIEERKKTLGDAVPVQLDPYISIVTKQLYSTLRKCAEEGKMVYIDELKCRYDGYKPIDVRLLFFPDVRRLDERAQVLDKFQDDFVRSRLAILDSLGNFFVMNGTEKPLKGLKNLITKEDCLEEEVSHMYVNEKLALEQTCEEGYPLEYSNVAPYVIKWWMKLRGISEEAYAQWLKEYTKLNYPEETE